MIEMLANLDPQESTYYKAILQNLFLRDAESGNELPP